MDSKTDRRNFIKKFGQVSLGLVAGQTLPVQRIFAQDGTPYALQPFSIIQGLTSKTETQITIDAPTGMEVLFRALNTEKAELLLPAETKVTHLEATPWSIHLVKFSNLELGEKYQLQVLNKDGHVIDQRFFKTLDTDNQMPRVAFISCCKDEVENVDAWKSVYKSKPDLLLIIGDSVYGDSNVPQTPEFLAKRYIEARSKIAFYHNESLLPVVLTWDDHDYGSNDGNGTFAHKDSSLYLFNTFYGREDITGLYTRGPGAASCLRAFGMQFLLLDDRYFRSHNKDKSGAMFGDTQTDWAFAKLKEFDGPTWLIQGNQFFGKFNKSESFEGMFKKDFKQFLDGVRATEKTVMFAGGDVHHSEIMTIEKEILGYETCELTSSGLHSNSSPFIMSNPRRRKSTTKRNFVFVDHKRVGEQLQMNFTSLDQNRKIRFADQFSLAVR